MRQGELGDPLYFDFIAFAQYATICAAFGAAPQVFQARVPCPGLSRREGRMPHRGRPNQTVLHSDDPSSTCNAKHCHARASLALVLRHGVFVASRDARRSGDGRAYCASCARH